MTDESVVVDNGQTYVSTETAVVATEAANRAKQWAQESERQANIATSNADTAVNAKDDAVAAKQYAEAAITDTNMVTVATDLRSTPSKIKTVANNISNVNTVAGISSAVTTVAGISSNVSAVAGNASNINAVASNASNINAVNANKTNINAVNANKTNIDKVAGDKTNIDTVAGISTAVSTVANNNTNVTTVATNISNVSTAATNISAINANAANITDIQNASTNAQKAKNWAIKTNGLVDNEDYSSKYYAAQSKTSAELSAQYANDKINQTHITNCITEIPQDIKLELNNGTLTLKVGSKITKLDGTQVNITADRSVTISVDTKWFVYCSNAGTSINNYSRVDRTGSGSSLPEDNTTYNYFYNTTDNKIYAWVSGAWSEQTIYFPICIVTVSGGAISSIDQIFNGFGYIGSTVFVLPGVKGLIPNGRNADGSLKNIEISFSKVVIQTNNVAYSGDIAITSDYFDLAQGNIYNEKDNRNYLSDGVTPFNRCIAGKFVKGTNGVITSLIPKTAFHAVDYNDSSTISGWSMPSSRYVDLNLGASGATYTAPANGYFCLDKAGTQNEYIDIRNNTTGLLRSKTTINAPETESSAVYMPCKKGDEIAVVYTATGTTNRFRFIYAEGENV